MFHIYALFHQTTSVGWYNSAVRIYFSCLNNRAPPWYRLWVILCRYHRALPLRKNTFACLFIAYNRTGLPRYQQVSLMRLLPRNTSHIIEILFPSSSLLFHLVMDFLNLITSFFLFLRFQVSLLWTSGLFWYFFFWDTPDLIWWSLFLIFALYTKHITDAISHALLILSKYVFTEFLVRSDWIICLS